MAPKICVGALEDDIAPMARLRLEEGFALLATHCPYAWRVVCRMVREVTIADTRVHTVLVDRRGRVVMLGTQFVIESASPAIALAVVYGAVRVRLAPYTRRASADRRAHHARRVHLEMVEVARGFDQAEDPGGYVPAVSKGHWEEWTDHWVGRAAIGSVQNAPVRLRGVVRDLGQLGAPNWLRRLMMAYLTKRRAAG